MTPVLTALALSAALGPLAPGPSEALQLAHGCHQNWQPAREGLHRHAAACELRRGLVDRQKRRDRSKQPPDIKA